MNISNNAHTRVPNLVYDVVCPLLTTAERDCLHYVVRRTYGFADPSGGRKARDTISLEQFENGITSGNYLLDLGTQLSRNTIRKALEGLENKELVEVRYSCLRCFWEGDTQKIDERTKAAACPRCRSSLSRSWALAELTPKKLCQLLNEYDKKHREWDWDKKNKRFVFKDISAELRKKQSNKDIEEEIQRLKNVLWYPELVEKAIAKASGQLKTSTGMSLSRKLNNFYKAVWEIQEEINDPPLLKYALEETIKGPALSNPNSHRWYRYLQVVLNNNKNNFASKQQSGEQMPDQENSMQDLLRKAANLNDSNRQTEARALLSDILSQTDKLSGLFDGDKKKCEYQLRLAFKQGSSDFVGVRVDSTEVDFYPEFDPLAQNQT